MFKWFCKISDVAFPITAKRATSVFSPLFSFPTFIRNCEVFLKWGRLYSKQNWREPNALNLWNSGCPACDSYTKSTISLDCKTVGFFLKISLEWCKASVRTSRMLHVRASHAKRACALPSLALCFQYCSRPFVWLFVSTWIWKKTDCFAVYNFLATKEQTWGAIGWYKSRALIQRQGGSNWKWETPDQIRSQVRNLSRFLPYSLRQVCSCSTNMNCIIWLSWFISSSAVTTYGKNKDWIR